MLEDQDNDNEISQQSNNTHDDMAGYDRYPNNSPQAALEYSAGQGLEAVVREHQQLNSYIDNQRKQINRLLMVSFALTILLVAMLIAFSLYPKNRYIVTNNNEAICTVDPRNNPNLTDATIADFAKDGVIGLYSFNYVNYMSHVEDVLGRYYTPAGRRDTATAIKEMVDTVNKQALTINAGIMGAAKIEQTGVNNLGQPFWIVRYPMVIDIYSGAKQPTNKQYYIVTVRVAADTASALNPKGLGITSVTLVPTDAPR